MAGVLIVRGGKKGKETDGKGLGDGGGEHNSTSSSEKFDVIRTELRWWKARKQARLRARHRPLTSK